MTVEQLRQLEQAPDGCGHCERRGDRLFVCQYHEGWGDALDASRFPALLDIASAADLVAVDASDDGSGHPAAIEDPNIAELAAALSRLEGATDVD